MRIQRVFATSLFASLIAALVISSLVLAAPLFNVPVTITQPDGERLGVFASGDEFYNWLHDAEGYTILQDPDTGYYVYADLVDGDLLPTAYIVGRADPVALGLEPELKKSWEERERLRWDFFGDPDAPENVSNAPKTGTINNLVVFIRFSGEAEFGQNISVYNNMYNDTAAGANSMINYFTEVSYNQLTYTSTFYPTPTTNVVSYQDAQPRAFYQPYNAVTNPIGYSSDTERRIREHTLLQSAVNHVNGLGQFPSAASIDGDSDGYVDSVNFVVSGSPDGWSNLLWPHKWSLSTYDVRIDGKRVWEYAFQLQSMINNSVLAHESFHVLGAPDLYRYTDKTITPIGKWDLMASNTNPPQHMSCYMKWKYGTWISSIQEITVPDTYTLQPATSSTGNCMKIASPNSASEYFVVEYRRESSSIFEDPLPGTGMLVYRINPAATGNADGPPDEVYVYRPDGTLTVNGTLDSAHFSSDVGRTAINDTTNPSSFLSDGSAGGLEISNVSAAGSTISFDFGLSAGCTAAVMSSPIPGSTLTGASQTFQWNSSGSSSYWLYVGNSLGAGDIYNSGSLGGSTTDTANGLPTDGRSLYVRLWTQCDGTWLYYDYTYTAALLVPNPISPSGTITDTTPVYMWTQAGSETQYQLWVNGPSGNVINQNVTTSCSSGQCSFEHATVLAAGDHVWWVRVPGGDWSSSLSFKVEPPVLIPDPISPTGTITDTTPTYEWTQAGSETQYQLWVNGPSGNVINALVTATCSSGQCSYTHSTVLAAGAHRWWVRVPGGTWSSSLTFTVQPPALIPVPISPSGTITDTTPTYTWTQAGSETQYQLWVNGPSGNVINSLVSATCSSGQCSYTHSTVLAAGAHRWWVRVPSGTWSSYLDFTVNPPSLIPDPIAPTGTVKDKTPTYEWTQAGSETQYQLWVNGPSGNVINALVTATCSSGQCSYTPSTVLANGAHRWWVRIPSGTWSSYLDFTVVPDLSSGFDSQFNGDSSGWVSHSGKWWIASGQWFTTTGLQNLWSNVSFSLATYADFDYRARMWRGGCDNCSNSVIVRGVPEPLDSTNDWDSGYEFSYTRNGYCSVWRLNGDGTYTALKSWATSSAINPYGAWNTLRVVASGSNLSFYINGTLVWSGTDTMFTSGRVGVTMYRDDASTNNQLWVDWATLSTSGLASPANAAISREAVNTEQQAFNDESPGAGGTHAMAPRGAGRLIGKEHL